MRKKQKETWYIYPRNHSHTNSVVSQKLSPHTTAIEIKCADNKDRNLWICDREFLVEMFAEKESGKQTLLFEVFRSIEDGPIVKYDFASDYKSMKLSAM